MSPKETQEPTPERWNATINLLRDAFNANDLTKLRLAVDYIQGKVGGSESQCTPMTDHDLKELLETGKGMINVGIGTLGERIFIENREIRMPIPVNDSHAKTLLKYQLNFKDLFDLTSDDLDPRRKF